MHLLSAQAGALQQEGEAIDLGQTPGAMVFASAADSELALLAGGVDRAGETGVRLANLLRLGHNMSVDLWIEQTVAHARLVVVRLLGGPAYWPYGVDQLTALAADGRFKLALLPGDATPDPILQSRSTVAPEEWTRLHALFTAGGPENADGVLGMMAGLAGPHPAGRGDEADLTPGRALPPPPSPPRRGEGGPTGRSVPASPLPVGERVAAERPGEGPRPFPRFGYWTPAGGVAFELAVSARPAVPVLFYRAALEGAGTATLVAICGELERQGLAAVPLMISTLKEGACVRFVRAAFAAHRPQAILNLTGFALGIDGLEERLNPFAETDAPVIQLVQGGRPEALWAADVQGLSAKDLAMQVVLPELDGRIGGIIVGHKAEAVWHAATECPLSAYAPDMDGITRAVALARNWVRLRATPRAERRVAMVLANYPIRDGRLANGVGYDAPASTVEILDRLIAARYELGAPPNPPAAPVPPPHKGEGWVPTAAQVPADGNALIELLQQGPTNAHPERGDGIAFAVGRYRELFAGLPERVRREVVARWGEPEADPFVREAAFQLPGVRFGNVVVMLQPARGYDRDEAAAYHDPDLVPPHAYLAAYLWMKHEFGAHALIHNGKHGSMEWLPGKANALDAASYPAVLWGELPHLYPFIVNDPGEGTQAKRRAGAVIIDHLVPPLTRAETYGPLKDLEALLDEYYAASGMDRRRLRDLRKRILDFTRDARLDRDIGLPGDETAALRKIDTFLCDLKEAQIRDGLHVFGMSPEGRLERDLLAALARVPRGERAADASIVRALADDLKLGVDPLTAELGEAWAGPELLGLVDVAPTPNPSPQGGGERTLSALSQAPLPLRGGEGVGAVCAQWGTLSNISRHSPGR